MAALQTRRRVTADRRSVSVVIPARDAETFVGDAVRSALRQTRAVLEVVVVVNASTDATARVVEDLAGQDPRVRLIESAAPGVSRARNLGMAVARGSLVAFLDADDVWEDSKLDVQLAVEDRGLYFGDCRFMVDDRPSGVRFHQLSPPPAGNGGHPSDLLLVMLGGHNPVPLCTVVADRAAVTELGGFDETLTHAEDWQLWLRLLLKGVSWSCASSVVAFYRVREGAASRDLVAAVAGERAALATLRTELEAAGLAALAGERERRLRAAEIVLARDAGSRLWDRLRDCAGLAACRPTVRSLLVQVLYTVAPRYFTTGRFAAARHDLPTVIARLDGAG